MNFINLFHCSLRNFSFTPILFTEKLFMAAEARATAEAPAESSSYAIRYLMVENKGNFYARSVVRWLFAKWK
jgi:hypothetical protein